VVPHLWIGVGFGLGLALWVSWLAPIGGLIPLIEAQRDMNAGYTAASLSWALAERMKEGVGWFLGTHFVMIGLAMVGLIALLRGKGPAVPLLIGWLLAGVIGFLGQMKFFHYHSLPLLAPLAVLGALGLVQAVRWLGAIRPLRNPRHAWVAGIALLVVTQSGARHRWAESWRDLSRVMRADTTRDDLWRELPPYDRTSFSDLMDLADHLRAETSEDATVYIWGYQPLVHFLSGRPSPTRFVHNPMLTVPWGNPAWREELVRDLRDRRPSHIVICRNDEIPWATGVEEDSEALFQKFETFRALVASDYDLAWETARFTVYRRLD
jgi:hypothetical protein